MANVRDLTVEVRDKALNRLGQIPLADLNLTLADQFNNVGTWTIVIRPDHPLAEALSTPGAGIVVVYSDGTTFASGPVTAFKLQATVQDPQGTLTVQGNTDTVLLADRLCFPDPTNPDPAASNSTAAHDIRTSTAEDLMYQFVSANIGPNAPSARRDTRLQMGTNGNRGPVQTKSVRFAGLGNTCSELALTGNLGFRVLQVGGHLEFQTYAVTDRSTSVRLDIKNNQLAGSTVTEAPPSVTRAIVAGQGDLKNRQFVERTSAQSLAAETQWGRRIEHFIDQRQSSDLAQLQAAGDQAIQEGGYAQLSVQVVPMEDVALQYGNDWSMGDIITVVVDGVETSSIVTGYVLKNDANGFKFGAVLGDPTFTVSADARLTKVESRVAQLERSSAGATAYLWNGTTTYASNSPSHYVGPADPTSLGLAVPDGTIWDQVTV